MNTIQLKIFKYLRYNSNNQGITLIELLIVLVIVGVLAAISFPNLLTQVGKARESEAVINLGALNRAQQAYFTEKSSFAGIGQLDNLEVPISNTGYYTFAIVDIGVQHAIGKNNGTNGTKDYLGGVQYRTDVRTYRNIICRSTDFANDYELTATDVINAGVNTSTNTIQCNSTTSQSIR